MNLISFLEKEKYISSGDAQSLSVGVDSLHRKNDTTIAQPYLRDYIQQQAQKQNKTLPASVYTTVDDNMSREIQHIADQTIYKLLRKDASDYGVVVIDRQSNQLRVMLGGMAYDGKAGQVNSTMSVNQP